MIPRFTDHAANERTFLAWIRTALAMVAFGAVLTKFDVFMRMVVTQGRATTPSHFVATALGVMFVILGIILFLTSYRRFVRTRNAIAMEQIHAPEPADMERNITIALMILGTAVLAALIVTIRT
ncbi:MAG: DUF202 domain-containing protein [Acetobacter sp.]|jgi:putative membrane protein|nr:DUF202 domain-containing protein [Acetobacter sp.]